MANSPAITRQVLIVLEAFDPLSNELVSNGLKVNAVGLNREPLINASGRFVWLRKRLVGTPDVWPTKLLIDPGRLHFEPEAVAVPALTDPSQASPADRLVRVVLRPTAAADFSGGVTAARGQLFESGAQGAQPVAGAEVQLAYRSWDAFGNPTWTAPARPVTANAKGEFGVFFRFASTVNQTADVKAGLVAVRIQVKRDSITRVTPDSFLFLADPQTAGRIPEGQMLARDLKVSWAGLV